MPAVPTYRLRVRDLGWERGVPSFRVQLLRADGPASFAVMSSGDLSPATADELVQGFGELGVPVEREPPPVPVAAIGEGA